MGKRKGNGMEQFNLGKWSDNEGKRKRKRKKKLGIEATIEKGKTDIEARNENVKAKHNSGDESKKTERMEAREYEHPDDDQEYVSFGELESISSDLEEIAQISEQLAEELGIRSRQLEESSVVMAKNLVDTAKEVKKRLEVKNMEFDKVKSEELSKVIGEMVREMKNDFELIEHRSDYVAQKFKEMSKIYRDLSTINLLNKSRRMRIKSNELRRRLEAMTIMAESGIEEDFLCKLGWADEHEVTEALSAMNKFKLSDEAYAIMNEHQQILRDKSHQKQVLQIVLTKKEYKDYMKDLIVAKKESRKIGYIFLKEGRTAMAKMVTVRSIQEYRRIKTESQKIGTFPQHIVVPALPECVPILEHARTDRYTVLLYLNQDAAE